MRVIDCIFPNSIDFYSFAHFQRNSEMKPHFQWKCQKDLRNTNTEYPQTHANNCQNWIEFLVFDFFFCFGTLFSFSVISVHARRVAIIDDNEPLDNNTKELKCSFTLVRRPALPFDLFANAFKMTQKKRMFACASRALKIAFQFFCLNDRTTEANRGGR